MVRFGAPDASLTGSAGVLAVGELMDRLGVVEALDAGIGPIECRARGVSGGELVASLAQCQLLDGKFVNATDRHRADAAAQQLSAVPGLASTTAGGLARRFTPDRVAGIEVGNTTVVAAAALARPGPLPHRRGEPARQGSRRRTRRSV